MTRIEQINADENNRRPTCRRTALGINAEFAEDAEIERYYFIACRSRFVLSREPFADDSLLEETFEDIVSWQGPLSEDDSILVISSSFHNPLDNPFDENEVTRWLRSNRPRLVAIDAD